MLCNFIKIKLRHGCFPVAKSVLRLRLTATDAAIHKKMFGSGNTTLVISNEKEVNDVMKIRICFIEKRR